MKLQEATDRSPLGVAFRGNDVLLDIIWPAGSECGYWFINGYKPMPRGRFENHTDWEPVKMLGESAAKLVESLKRGGDSATQS
jgi:hypothetical protein